MKKETPKIKNLDQKSQCLKKERISIFSKLFSNYDGSTRQKEIWNEKMVGKELIP